MTLLARILDVLFDAMLLRYGRGLRREARAREEAIDPVLGGAVEGFSRSFLGATAEPRAAPSPGDEVGGDAREAEVLYESAQVLESSQRNAYEVRVELPGISHASQVEVRELAGSLEVKARLPEARAGYFAIVRKPGRFPGSPTSRVEDGALVLRWEGGRLPAKDI